MAGDAYCSPQFTGIGSDYSKDNGEVSVENENELKQMLIGNPPRHLSVVRHSISTATLVAPADLVVNTCSVIWCNVSCLST